MKTNYVAPIDLRVGSLVIGDGYGLDFGIVLSKQYIRSSITASFSGTYKVVYLTPEARIISGTHYGDLKVVVP